MLDHFTPENRFHAPLTEKLTDELLGAVKRDAVDSDSCRAELHSRGWTDEFIFQFTGR